MDQNTSLKTLLKAPALAAALVIGIAAPAQAQIPALLPEIEDVEPGAPLPIDGMWTVREISQPIIIEDGHAYAVEGWVHALILRIMPGHVVITDLVENPDGTISGRDLPLMAPITMTPVDDMSIRVDVHGLIPVTYHLDRSGSGGPYEQFDDDADEYQPDLPEDGGSWFPAEDE